MGFMDRLVWQFTGSWREKIEAESTRAVAYATTETPEGSKPKNQAKTNTGTSNGMELPTWALVLLCVGAFMILFGIMVSCYASSGSDSKKAGKGGLGDEPAARPGRDASSSGLLPTKQQGPRLSGRRRKVSLARISKTVGRASHCLSSNSRTRKHRTHRRSKRSTSGMPSGPRRTSSYSTVDDMV